MAGTASTANALVAAPVQSAPASDIDAALARVQSERLPAARVTQRVQTAIQQNIIRRALANKAFDLPWIARIALRVPGLSQLPARIFALGPRPATLQEAL